MCTCLIGGHEVKFIMYRLNREQTSVLNVPTYLHLLRECSLQPTTVPLSGYGGAHIKALGKVRLPLCYAGRPQIWFSFFVTSH